MEQDPPHGVPDRHEWAGRPEQAKATFTRTLHEINPSNEAVLAPKGFGMPVYLALTYAGLGEEDKALQQAHLAIEQLRWLGKARCRSSPRANSSSLRRHACSYRRHSASLGSAGWNHARRSSL